MLSCFLMIPCGSRFLLTAVERAAARAASISALLSHFEPLRVLPERRLPADSSLPGHIPAPRRRDDDEWGIGPCSPLSGRSRPPQSCGLPLLWCQGALPPRRKGRSPALSPCSTQRWTPQGSRCEPASCQPGGHGERRIVLLGLPSEPGSSSVASSVASPELTPPVSRDRWCR